MGWITAVLDDALGLPYAARYHRDLGGLCLCLWQYISFFFLLALQCFVIAAVQSELSNNMVTQICLFDLVQLMKGKHQILWQILEPLCSTVLVS